MKTKTYPTSWLVMAILACAALSVIILASQPVRAAGPWYVTPGGSDGNDCLNSTTTCATINGALNKPGFVAGDTILVATGVYTGTGTEVVLLNKSATISGGWDASFTAQSGTSTIDGQGTRQDITVNSGITAIVERFAVQNGYVGYYSDGGGIHNSGTMTLNNTTVSGNTASSYGGGIGNDGTLTLNNSSVSGNTANGAGGGIYNLGTLTLNNSSVSGNTANGAGGGIYNVSTLTLNNSTISGNMANGAGGGIDNDFGTATLNNSTVSGNTANGAGGGIYNGNTATLNNSTVSGNTANGAGGGIYIYTYGTLTLNNSTVSGNTAIDGGGGIYNYYLGTATLNNSTVTNNAVIIRGYGGGIGGNGALLRNSILAGNTAASGPDCSGTVNSADYNLVGNTSGCTFTSGSGDLTNVNAGLGPLIGSAGKPKYHPLLWGSPAIDAGNPTGCTGSTGPLTTDQRGVARVERCDIGAYEYTTPGPAALIYAFAGTPQHAAPLDMYMMPLQAAVLDSLGSPVSDTIVLFSAPMSGASGTFADTSTYTTTATTAEGGVATAAIFTANGLTGTFTVTATVGAVATPANFLVGNLAWYVAVGGNDNNDCLSPATACASINGALGKPGIGLIAGDTILVATGVYTSTGTEVVLLNKNVTLSGGWNAGFTAHSGTSTIDGQGTRRGMAVNSDVTAVVERLTIQNCSDSGINNNGTLTLNNITVSSNTSGSEGGGIRNYGTMTLNDSSVSNNIADGIGGGIYNAGTLTLNDSTVSSNTANHDGGGVWNFGTLTLNNSTVSGNTAPNTSGSYGLGGGIYSSRGVLTLNNSTVTENTARYVNGIYNYIYSSITLQNTILAGNTVHDSGLDLGCWGTGISAGYNIIGNTYGTFNPIASDLTNVDAKLDPLEGSPTYHPLLPGSPAINAGNPGGCVGSTGPLTTDQRGFPRFGRCDIGAYELQPIGFSTKAADRTLATPGGPITFTITLTNGGTTDLAPVYVTDTLPISLTYVDNSLYVPGGRYGYSSGVITWTGTLSASEFVTITFGVTTPKIMATITNTAIIDGGGEIITRTATVMVANRVYLPVIIKH